MDLGGCGSSRSRRRSATCSSSLYEASGGDHRANGGSSSAAEASDANDPCLNAADSLEDLKGHKDAGPGKLVKRGGKEIHMEAKSQEKTHVDRWAELSAAEREAAEANYEAMGEKARARADEARREKGLAPRDRSGRSRGSVERKTGDEDNSFSFKSAASGSSDGGAGPSTLSATSWGATPTASSGESAAGAPPKPASGFVPKSVRPDLDA